MYVAVTNDLINQLFHQAQELGKNNKIDQQLFVTDSQCGYII